MPAKSVKNQMTSSNVVAKENTLETLQNEWTSVASERALLVEKLEQLNTRSEEIVSSIWKQMNKITTEPVTSTIIETPSIVVPVLNVVEKVSKPVSKPVTKMTEGKKSKQVVALVVALDVPTEVEQDVLQSESHVVSKVIESEVKKSRAKPKPKTKDIEVEVIKKTPVKKQIKNAEVVNELPKSKTIIKLKDIKAIKETDELKAQIALMNNSSSSDTDLESLSSCSSESECSGPEED